MNVNHFQKANHLKQKGSLEEAIVFYEKAILQNPNFYLSYYGLAETLAQLGRWDEAVNYYSQSIAINSNYAWSYYKQGEALAQLNNWHEALNSYHRAVEINPKHYRFWSKLGELIYQLAINLDQELLIESLQEHNQLLENLLYPTEKSAFSRELSLIDDQIFLQKTIDFDNSKFIEDLYQCYLLRESDETGKTFYLQQLINGIERQKVIQMFRDSQEFKEKLITSFRSTQLWKINDQLFWQITGDLQNEFFIEEVYQSYLKREPDEQGKTHYLQVLKQSNRSDIVAMFRQSSEFITKLKSSIRKEYLQAAIVAYRHASDLNPNTHQLNTSISEAMLQIGKLLAEGGQLNEAIDVYQQTLKDHQITKYNTTNREINVNLGQAYCNNAIELAQAGKIDEAIKQYRQSLEVAPSMAEAQKNLVYLLVLFADRYDEAIKSCDHFISHNPSSPVGYLCLAYTYTIYDEFDKAVPYWRKGFDYCAQSNNDIQQSLFNWGDRATFDRGKIKEATKLYQIVYEIQSQVSELHGFNQSKIIFLSPHFVSRIGHIACMNYYIKMGILGLRPLLPAIVLVEAKDIANSHLLKYWRDYIHVISEPSFIECFYKNKMAPVLQEYWDVWNLGDGKVMETHDAIALTQKQWEDEGRSPLLTLSSSDYEQGWSCLQQLGVSKDDWFVCLHVRESGYWGGDSSYRNSNIKTYFLAIESIVARGGWVIRMGDPTMTPLPPMAQVIDYAHSELKSDWMDVFLCASCRFMIGTNSGFAYVPSCFGVPVAMTNYLPMASRMFSQKDIYIPKLYYSEKQDKYLSFIEAMTPPFGHVYSAEGAKSLGIKLIDNTPEEINDLVLEILERLDGTVKYTEEDDRLQQVFDKVAEVCHTHGISRIGKSFLRKYSWLLPKTDTYWELGKIFALYGKISEAISCYQKEIAINPNWLAQYFPEHNHTVNQVHPIDDLISTYYQNSLQVLNILEMINFAKTNKPKDRSRKLVVLVAEVMSTREVKIGYALKSIGWQVVLLRKQEVLFQEPGVSYFDEIYFFSSPEEALFLATQFNPIVYHIFSHRQPGLAALFIRYQVGQIVFDEYDPISGMMKDDYLRSIKASHYIPIERYCLENANALCCRDITTQYAKRYMGYQYRKRIFFPEYCWDFPEIEIRSQTSRLSQGEINVTYGGWVLTTVPESDPRNWNSWLAKSLAKQGIHYHLYPIPWDASFEEIANKNSYFHYHKTSTCDRLIDEYSQYDFGVLIGSQNFHEIEDERYNSWTFNYGVENKIFDYIDAGLIVITKKWRFIHFISSRYGCSIEGSVELLTNGRDKLKETLTPEMKANVAKAKKAYSIRKQIHRLVKFYDRI